MKSFLYGILINTLCFFPIVVRAENGPHRLQAGEVMSSDVFNEIFQYFDSRNSSVNLESLVGIWDCQKFGNWSGYSQYTQSNDGLFSYVNLELEVYQDEGGSYQWESTSAIPFNRGWCEDQCDHGNGRIAELSGFYGISFQPNPCRSEPACSQECTGIYTITATNDESMRINSLPDYNGCAEDVALFCTRQNLKPISPETLTALFSNRVVTLTWSDESDDETGFKILRRDSLTGEFAEIGTASADATSYTDTLTADGKYWYRVFAVNENGDSLGSNVVKVTLGDEDDTQSLKNELRMMRERMQLIEDELGESGGRP